MAIQPYLFFEGRCEEALEFYRKALGAEVVMLMRYKDSPEPAPKGARTPPGDKVMHSSLRIGDAELMASDGFAHGKPSFQGFSLSLNARDDAEARRWFNALGAFMTCIAIGAMFSLAVFLQPITQSTGWSHTAVSAAMTLNFLAMGAAGFGWGALGDRIGPRPVVLAGAVLLGLGLFLASRAQSALEFQLTFGLLVGVAVGSFFSPMIAAVMGWISQHRGLAVSLVSVGVGVAPMTMSPFAAWLITQMDWRAAQVVIAVLVWATSSS